MKVVIIGATGFVGSSITNELIGRNLEVLGIAKNEKTSNQSNVTFSQVDALNVTELAKAITGYDVVVSAFSPGWTHPDYYNAFIEGSQAIQEAVKLAQVKRLIVIGGAGSLYVAENVQAVDTDELPADFKFVAIAARDYLNILKEEKEMDWACFSPALEMHPGVTTGRTGNYRLGTDYVVRGENGRSMISVEDLAVVIADEIESPKHHQVRFTAAY